MSSYKILRWDAVLAPNGLNKMPIIYIVPDVDFITFASANNDTLLVEINGTNTIYDGKQALGVVNRSSFMPNLESQTNVYVIYLECVWFGYPEPTSLGDAKFYGLKA